MMEKYRVKNLDCAHCAIKIETAVKKVPGVHWASLDFATLTLHIDAEDTREAIKAVHETDPNIELKSVAAVSGSLPDSNTFNPKSKLIELSLAAVMFAIILFFDYGVHVRLPEMLFMALAMGTYLFSGWNVLASAVRTVRKKAFFDENVLMVIATVGAMAIGAFSEAVGVMLFYKAGEFFQELAVNRSRGSIRALLAEKPGYANLQTESGLRQVPPEAVRVGEVIVVKPGEKMPLDGRVLTGSSQVDPSVLTGESVPKTIRTGDCVMAGEVNMTGAVMVEVTRPYAESSIARMLEMVENASARKTATENFITVFARYYTPAMVAAAACIAFIPPLFIAEAAFSTWIYRALVLLVISCPCALVISIPLGYFGGIGRASGNGILVKGSNYLDALAGVKTVVFDKTGTLTEGVFKVKDVIARNGYSADRILEFAAMAEQHSNHPIARSILDAYIGSGNTMPAVAVDDHAEISGAGVKTQVNGTQIIVGNDRLMIQEQIDFDECPIEGTVAHVAVNGTYAGYVVIGDRIRKDSVEAIAALRRNGVKRIIMLTGDNQCAADSIAAQLDLDEYHAGLLPEDKVRIFEQLQEKYGQNGRIAFVGDGINDAPVIARADVGVAMGVLGSDAAIETADVVLMTDSPAKMAEAVAIGKYTRMIVWQNIFLALSIKAVVIVLGTMGLASMWAAVFADVGTALMAVVNSTRALKSRIRTDEGSAEEKTFPAEPEEDVCIGQSAA